MQLKTCVLFASLVCFVACNSTNDTVPSAGKKDTSSTSVNAPPPPAMKGDASKNPDMRELAAEVDVNKDGKMSREEWKAKGLPESSFNAFEKGRGYVTLDDYKNNPAPPGIDLNGDGKLTVEEFKEFDKKMSQQGPPKK